MPKSNTVTLLTSSRVFVVLANEKNAVVTSTDNLIGSHASPGAAQQAGCRCPRPQSPQPHDSITSAPAVPDGQQLPHGRSGRRHLQQISQPSRHGDIQLQGRAAVYIYTSAGRVQQYAEVCEWFESCLLLSVLPILCLV